MSYKPENVAFGSLRLDSAGKVATAQLAALLADINALSPSSGDILYYNGSNVAALSTTTAGRALLDDADNAAQRTTLGLGTIATQDASNVSITGGSISGVSVAVSYAFGTDITSTGTFTRSTLNGKVHHVDASGGSVSMNLEALSAWTDGDWFIVKLINNNSGAATLTLNPDGSETIDGAATKVLYAQMETVEVYKKGSGFYLK